MTGPEHYREAERLIDSAFRTPDQYGDAAESARQDLAAAQAHATLAVAAAVAFNGDTCASEADGWWEAAGTKPGEAP